MSSLARVDNGFPDEAVAASVESWARNELNALAVDRAGSIPPSVLTSLAELGLFGLTLPQRFGGFGAGLPLAIRVVETLASHDCSVATTLGLHLGLGTRALVRYGNEAVQREWLPRLSQGETIAAFATTEPGAGSDLSRLSTKVVAHGKRLSLSGEKAYVTNGAFAGLLTVTARSMGTDGLASGITMVAIPTCAPGLTRLPEEVKLGLRGSSTTGFRFEDVRVPSTNMLGSPATGSAQLEHSLAWGRTLMSAGCVGAAATALDKALDYTAMRRQFGRTLITQPVVRGQVATCTVVLDAMRALVASTATQESDEALHRSSVSAKVFCSAQGGNIVDTALQLHGATGYMENTGLALLWRDVRVTRIFEGANDVLATHAGMLELRSPASVEPVPRSARAVAQAVQRQTARLKGALGVRVFAHPELLHRLGTAVVWRDALIAGCRANKSNAWQRILVREACAALRTTRHSLHAADDISEVLEGALG